MTVLDRLPLERIGEQARELHFGRTALTALVGLFWLAGWVAARVCGVLWVGVTWAAAAVKTGWVDARAGARDGAD